MRGTPDNVVGWTPQQISSLARTYIESLQKYDVRAFLLIAFVAACSTTDDRPQTLAYVTETVLQPYCATAECHSTSKRQSDIVFDSVAEAQRSIKDKGLIDICATPPCMDSPGKSYLLTVITTKDAQGNRMPLDEPVPNLDDVYIANWIIAGAPGYTP